MDTYIETTPIHKAQRTLWKMELKDCKSQRIRGLLLFIISPSNVRIYTHYVPKHEWYEKNRISFTPGNNAVRSSYNNRE